MEEDFDIVAEYIHESIQLTQFICDKLEGGSKAPLKVCSCKICNFKSFIQEFKNCLYTDPEVQQRVKILGDKVHAFASSFPIPGHVET